MESPPPSFFEVLGYSAEFHYVTTTGKFYNFNQYWPPYICSRAPPIFQIRKCYSVGTLRIDAVH